jgi:hypothetical protein
LSRYDFAVAFDFGIRRRVDELGENRFLLVADVRDQAFDREHRVGGELGLELALVLHLRGDRLDAIRQLDVDFDVRRPLVLGVCKRAAGRREQTGHDH